MASRIGRGKKNDGEPPTIGAAAVAGALATYGMDTAGGRIVAPALGMKPPSIGLLLGAG